MFPSVHVHVDVDLARIRANALAIAARTKVDLIAVVKADAYGLGAARVAETIEDTVAGFCVFSLTEAVQASLWEIAHKPILSLGPADPRGDAHSADAFVQAHVRPSVWTAEQARVLAAASPVLCLDTGMQRFSCPPAQVDELLATADFSEAFTHAINVAQARMLADRFADCGMKLHAAGSALLDEPSAWLDAVRPGIALYRGAARVHTRLVEVRQAKGSAGYTGFRVDRFGVILCGYANGLRPGLCLVNGAQQRVLEVGMQSAFVEIGLGDKSGDEVVLLGDALSEAGQAEAWKTSEQQVLVSLAGAGIRAYRSP
jgi:alanine racemase